MNIVPHHELIEREQAEHRFFNYIPSRLGSQLGAHSGEHASHVDTTLVLGQRLQTLQVYLVLLAQHLHQRGIDGHLLVATAHNILVAATANQLDRHEQQRCEAGSNALLGFIPAHHAEHHEQRVGTVLFKGGTRFAVEEFLGARQLVGGEIGVQAVEADVLSHQLLQIILVEA